MYYCIYRSFLSNPSYILTIQDIIMLSPWQEAIIIDHCLTLWFYIKPWLPVSCVVHYNNSPNPVWTNLFSYMYGAFYFFKKITNLKGKGRKKEIKHSFHDNVNHDDSYFSSLLPSIDELFCLSHNSGFLCISTGWVENKSLLCRYFLHISALIHLHCCFLYVWCSHFQNILSL